MPVGAIARGACTCAPVSVQRGERLYEIHDPARAIFTVLSGTFKTCSTTNKSDEQVMGFYARGAILGLDGLATGRHCVSAVAIEDSEVCHVSAEELAQHCVQDENVARCVHAAMAWEIDTRQRMILALSRKTATERVASFIIEQAAANFALGRAFSEMELPMNRGDISSYLGLTLGTVSRIFSRLRKRGLLAVRRKRIRVLDFERLRRLAD